MLHSLHPTSKATEYGYLPMINIRGAKGRMVGSRVPKGADACRLTFRTALEAELEARVIALSLAMAHPEQFKA